MDGASSWNVPSVDGATLACGGVSVDVLKAEMKQCELAVVEDVEGRMRAQSKAHRMQIDTLDNRLKAAESCRRTQEDMLLAKILSLEQHVKEQATALQAQSVALEAMLLVSSKTQQEHATAVQTQSQTLEAMRKEHATAQQAQQQELEALRTETRTEFEVLRTETSNAHEEQATAAKAQRQELKAMLRTRASKAKQEVKAMFEEVTRKYAAAAMDKIAQLARLTVAHDATAALAEVMAAHLAGHVPEVATHIGGEELNAALVKLRGEDAKQRVGAVEALRGLGGSSPAAGAAARHALVAALRGDAEPDVRLQASHDLFFLPDATLVPHLTATLREDENINVRRCAAMSLGRVGAPAALTAVEALTSAMRTHADEGVRAAAAGALLALDAQGLTAEAQGVALQVLCSGAHEVDRQCAAWAVGRGRGPEARTALEKAASGDAHKNVRAEAKMALETLRT